MDLFHQHPERQHILLANPANLPIQTQITVGGEVLELRVTAVFDQTSHYVGTMATWSLVTEQEQLKARATELADAVATSATEISASIREISRSTAETAALSTTTQEQFGRLSAGLERLAQRSRGIEAIIELIENMAGQTNLLALNATIEAVRAGQAGQGFAVVASEVKQLAQHTRGATGKIQEAVQAILENVRDTIQATETVAASMHTVNESTTSIASAIEEQSATMEQLTVLAAQMRK
jgi:methyl-accepting chemotaxis protein